MAFGLEDVIDERKMQINTEYYVTVMLIVGAL
jgi:hypothetical protein